MTGSFPAGEDSFYILSQRSGSDTVPKRKDILVISDTLASRQFGFIMATSSTRLGRGLGR